MGDSPLWLFREGQLERLNADHSMAPVLADLVATGRMTAEEAAQDPSRHSLRSAVMGDEIHLIDVSSQPVAVEQGDRLLLASDGLMTLSDQEIAAILKKTQDASLEDSAAALIQAVEAAEHPQQDNTTVLLYALAEGAELAAADVGEEETTQGKPQLKRNAGADCWGCCYALLSYGGCFIGLGGAKIWLLRHWRQLLRRQRQRMLNPLKALMFKCQWHPTPKRAYRLLRRRRLGTASVRGGEKAELKRAARRERRDKFMSEEQHRLALPQGRA